ncbi:helix-turn-helix domain-containing protein [Enterococcus faecalis]|uniref:helix-turn-helix domain-containing protein n=1 Tax=Enterococcus faecalis TaxID=1351 RepID=UPI003CE4A462
MTESSLRPGDVIRTQRVALGITQDALAEQVGVNKATISRIERGYDGGWMNIVALLQAVGAEVIVR